MILMILNDVGMTSDLTSYSYALGQLQGCGVVREQLEQIGAVFNYIQHQVKISNRLMQRAQQSAGKMQSPYSGVV